MSAIHTPRPAEARQPTAQLAALDTLRTRTVRRERVLAQKVIRLEIDVLSLKYDKQALMTRLLTLERHVDALLEMSITLHVPTAEPHKKQTTLHEIPAVIPTSLPDQVVDAAAGHEKLYSRHANVVYLNGGNLDILAADYGIRDIIWGPHLVELRCDNSLTNDQILCVTEEVSREQDSETTQKRAIQKPVEFLSTASQIG